MTSNDIYTPFIPDQYCVYHTTYSGTLLPQNYIGSSSVDNVIVKKYHGSVKSARYKDIWLSELQLHPELFSTSIVSLHDTRSNATHKELQVQKLFNVVKSDLFINRSYASINGFGDTTFTPEEKEATSKKMSVTRKGVPKSEETKSRMSAASKGVPKPPEQSARMSALHKGKTISAEQREKLSIAGKGKKHSEETKAKIGAGNKGKVMSDESKLKMSAAHLKQVECPHCGKIGGRIMYRWHFDNCKQLL